MATFKTSISKFFAYFVIGIVVLSLAGFGIQDVILGSNSQNIAKIGNKKIVVKEFIDNLDREMRAFSQANKININIDQAISFGLVNKALNDLIARKIIDNDLYEKKISRGDNAVASYIADIQIFRGLDNKFDLKKYTDFLRRNNIKTSDFEDDIKNQLTRELFLEVFESPQSVDRFLVEKALDYYFESRNINFFELDKNTFLDLADKPLQEEISRYFQQNSKDFNKPNKKKITVGIIDPSKLAAKEKINNIKAKEYYENNIDDFITEETRLIDVLSFTDDEINRELIRKIKKSPDLFLKEVSTRKLSLDDISLGRINKNSSSEKAILKLFEFEDTGLYGPYNSELGLTLYRIREIYPEKIQKFEDIKKEIKNTIAIGEALDFIDEIRDEINNEIASGQLLEDLQKNYPFDLVEYEIIGDKLPKKFENSELFKKLLRNASSLVSAAEQLENNTLLAIRIDKEIEERPMSLDEAKAQITKILYEKNALNVAEQFITKETNNASSNFINKMFQLNRKRSTFYELENLKVYRFSNANKLSENVLIKIFNASKDGLVFYYNSDKLMVAQIEKIKSRDVEDGLKEQFISQRNSAYSQNLKQDFINSYLKYSKKSTDIEVNEKLLQNTLSTLKISY